MKIENNKRLLNIIFNKSGSGSINTKISLPKKWIDTLELNEENRSIIAEFKEDTKEIILKKALQ